MPQGIGAGIPVAAGIGQRADTDAVQNEQYDPLHYARPPSGLKATD
jgi:hypothetical protein